MAGRKATQKSDTAISSATKSPPPSVTKRNVASNNSNTAKIQEIDEDDFDEDEEDDDDEDDDDSDASDSSDIDDIPDPEKWRIIKESGIMEQVKASDDRSRGTAKSSSQRTTPQADEERDYIFEGIFFSIPTTCLFIIMDILVHRQYGETYAGADVFRKVIKIFPAILLMVYFSNKHKTSKITQVGMFVVSTLCGCYFLHTMFRSPAMGIMLRAPGIITILVYCIVQLHLLPAVVSLGLCWLYYNFGNVKYDHRR